MNCNIRRFLLAACCGALASVALPAPAQPVLRGAQVSEAVQAGISLNLRDLPDASGAPGPARPAQRISRPTTGAVPGGAAQTNGGPPAMPATIFNFDGMGVSFPGYVDAGLAPSSTNIAVGPNHIVQVVNTKIMAFNKSGTVVMAPKLLNLLWTGYPTTDGNTCSTHNDGDPIVQYDAMANRWLVSQFDVVFGSPPSYECIAVSQTSDPTGAYYLYDFFYGTNIPDYPKVGVWPDAYYFTYNMFQNVSPFSYLGANVCAMDRASMLLGHAATQHCFLTAATEFSLLPADLDGATLPPAGAPNYLLSLGSAANTLALWKFHADFVTPANATLTGPMALGTNAFAQACGGGNCIPQPSPGTTLESVGDRLMYRLAYRNFGDHEALVANHSVVAGASVGVRWYEIRSPGSSPTIFQQGTYAPDTAYRWMGSIAMDKSGDMALGFSVSSALINPGILYTGRLVGDAAGTMGQGEGSIVAGAGVENGTLHRWGDWTSMRIDPSDDCTFWYTNQYYATTGTTNWSTRIASFKFPTCGVAAAPVFQSATSRRVHGAAGTFDLPLSLADIHNPSTEPRQGPTQTIVFTFDKPVNAATVNVSEGAATAGAPTFNGNDLIVDLTGVADIQYVTVDLTNVGSTDGGVGGSGSVRVGFLAGDVNQGRSVTVSDLVLVNRQQLVPLTISNYLMDVNVSGSITVSDKVIVNRNLLHTLPAP